MKNIFNLLFLTFAIIFGRCAYSADSGSKRPNHKFDKVSIEYPTGDLCSFQFSPVYFCDDRHISEIEMALETRHPDFNHHYILLSILEREEYYERSLVAIDTETGIAYPFPFDFYSGRVDARGNVHDYGRVTYSLNDSHVCVTGSIVAYRETDSGKLCWDFNNGRFVGHRTPYTDE